MLNAMNFKKTNNNSNIPRIGGMSLLPTDMEWPVNPNGAKLTLIFNLPTDFLNSVFKLNFPKDQIVSAFTTYDKEDYFLDSIVYNGDKEELENIKKGFTKVLLHSIGTPRNDSEYIIPAKKIIMGKEIIESGNYYGSSLGDSPVLLQKEPLDLNAYRFCMQVCGGDFPQEFEDVFYLNDSIGYLYLNSNVDLNDIGVFFTQCT